ncbi:hypothetical protein [Ralstonia chuxiongensis]|uniref:hypothetical protein n=1 Tax=Ralstonia chuxiongensis TaxID=2957504 RepID=UPI0028F5CA4D|nr:hypothetical protein [Ralstonia chuxiongensis]CAJ0784526.1 hypothetical protein R8510_05270 [Ralstonia chuxiongensis]
MHHDSAPTYRENDNNFVLKNLIIPSINKRRNIFGVVLLAAFALFALVSVSVTQRYTSTGSLRVPLSFFEYNSQKSALLDARVLQRYLQAEGLLGDKNAQHLLGSWGASFVAKHVKTVLSLSKEDVKNLADINSKVEADANGLIGFDISYSSNSPESAQNLVRITGGFVQDILLSESLKSIVLAHLGIIRTKKHEIQVALSKQRLALNQAEFRLASMRDIAKRYPGVPNSGPLQLLSSTNEKESARYLSPAIQVVALETEISDLRAGIRVLNINIEQAEIRQRLLESVKRLSDSEITGSALMKGFEKNINDFFRKADLSDDKLMEVKSEISLLAEQIRSKRIIAVRFVSGPTLPKERSAPPVLASLIVAFGLAVLLGLVVVVIPEVLVVRGNRKSIDQAY